ncbi:MAG: DMT family transporter [Candidatus Eiseniibacteriota bacterium]|nr:MAG: DMT family transporter [Candidatus Eisenbacteria bacterium]
MTAQNRAYVFALLAVFCWSTVASAFKLTLRHVDYLTLLFYSSFVAAVFLLVVLLAQGKGGLLREAFRGPRGDSASAVPGRGSAPLVPRSGGSGTSRGDSAGSTARTRAGAHPLLRSAAVGFLNPFLYYVVLFKAYSLLPAQEAQPLNYTWPLMLVLLSAPMLGEKIRPLSVVALFISFFGVLVVSTRGDVLGLRFTNLPGALLAMGSAIVWALFWLKNLKDERDEVLKLFLNFLFGFLYVAATIFVLSRLGPAEGTGPPGEVPAEIAGSAMGAGGSGAGAIRAFPPPADLEGLFGCLYAGIMEMGLAFVLWLKALRQSEGTAKVSNLIFLSPFISLIFIRLVVGETILPSSILGLGFIACGILIQRKAASGSGASALLASP